MMAQCNDYSECLRTLGMYIPLYHLVNVDKLGRKSNCSTYYCSFVALSEIDYV